MGQRIEDRNLTDGLATFATMLLGPSAATPWTVDILPGHDRRRRRRSASIGVDLGGHTAVRTQRIGRVTTAALASRRRDSASAATRFASDRLQHATSAS
jgi:hypothetical protein